ncbi:MAG TPA: hypothetical protein VGF06_03260 [Terriglobales bacterium]|jgi:hypothetical protein
MRPAYISILLALVALALPAFGDDREKTAKELTKVTAMATDATGRLVVNLTMADTFKVKRAELVANRHESGLNYGDLFVARELMSEGRPLPEIVAQLRTGKTIYQVADDQHADWKKVLSDAKAVNKKIDENLYKHFATPAAQKDRDQTDPYSVVSDGVKADNNVKDQDVLQARDRYVVWRDRGRARTDAKLDNMDELNMRHSMLDIKDRGPQVDQTGMNTRPQQH